MSEKALASELYETFSDQDKINSLHGRENVLVMTDVQKALAWHHAAMKETIYDGVSTL